MHSPLRSIAAKAAAADPAHDLSHCERVLTNALRIAMIEGGDRDVLTAAAYLHDIANLPKNHPDSRLSSERSAAKAAEILKDLGMPPEQIVQAQDAILCHSYSRGLTPQTLEGRVFQDADRLDALGAIGIARVFSVSGATHRPLMATQDPFLKAGRTPNDKDNALDHFVCKLFKLEAMMQTETGRRLARERIERMRRFVQDLENETTNGGTPGAPA